MVFGRYDTGLDRESAYESLERRTETRLREERESAEREAREEEREAAEKARNSRSSRSTRSRAPRRGSTGAMVTSVLRQSSTVLVRELVRGIFGSLRR